MIAPVREINVERWSLADVSAGGLASGIREEAILLLWTELDVLGGYALNVFAPRGHVLWNADCYRAFSLGGARVVRHVISRGDARETLAELIREIGWDVRSIESFVLLGGLTRMLGDKFCPDQFPPDYFLLARRHQSHFVPFECRDAVSRFFQRIVAHFGESATRRAADMVSFVVTEQTRAAFPLHYLALGKPIGSIRGSEQSIAVEVLEALLRSQPENEEIGPAHPHIGAFSGDISCVVAAMDTSRSDWSVAAGRIVELRAQVAIAHCAKPVSEKLLLELNGAGWRHPAFSDLRDYLRGLLLTELARCATVFDDPFESWPSPDTVGLGLLDRRGS